MRQSAVALNDVVEPALDRLSEAVSSHLGFAVTEQQRQAALLLRSGSCVEMLAGEGKTVVVALAAALHALEGRRVHVLTANDYLADRDRWWMQPVYESVGVSVSAVLEHMFADDRRAAYGSLIVYGTLREFAFDFLRDRMLGPDGQMVQPALDVVVVDEADQTLLDEASTPLVIAGEPVINSRTIRRADRAVRALAAQQREVAETARQEFAALERPTGRDSALMARALMAEPHHQDMHVLSARYPYLKRRAETHWDNGDGLGPDPTATRDLLCAVAPDLTRFSLLPAGVEFLHQRLGPIYDNARPDGRRAAVVQQVHQLLIAHLLLRRDVDYLVEEGRVALIDRDTGRLRLESRYRQGLQPAVEAKEGVDINPDSPSRAVTSVPGFVRRYSLLSGITATARSGEQEFKAIYSLPVAAVDPACPPLRSDRPARLYPSADHHYSALLDEVQGARELGRPVLVATRSVVQSEAVSAALWEAGVPHRVLNAGTGLEEHDVIVSAGQAGAVTVATNVAGRGSDIVLSDGLTDEIVAHYCRMLRVRLNSERAVVVRGASVAETDLAQREAERAGWAVLRESSEKLRVGSAPVTSSQVVEGRPLEFGLGLLVVVTEFNDSERVELQLRGRAGRNGHHGSTVAILSGQDPLLLDVPHNDVGVDDAGHRCVSGPDLERELDRLRQRAGLEARARRSVYLEYAAIMDAQTDGYHGLRRELMTESDEQKRQRLARAALTAAARLTEQHFPNLTIDRYRERFDEFTQAVADRFRVDAADLLGAPMDQLADELAGELMAVLPERDVAPAVWLENVDLMWERHLDLLWERAYVSMLTSSHGLKTSVAEYIIEARRLWGVFAAAVDEQVLECWLSTGEGS